MHRGYGIERASHMASYAYRRLFPLKEVTHPACPTHKCPESDHYDSRFYVNAIPSEVRQIAHILDGEFDLSFPSERAISQMLTARDVRSTHVDKPLFIREHGTELQAAGGLVATALGMSLCMTMAPDFLASKKMRSDMVDFCVRMSSMPHLLQQMWDDTSMELTTNPYLTSPTTISMANAVRNNMLKIFQECAVTPTISDKAKNRKSVLVIVSDLLGITMK